MNSSFSLQQIQKTSSLDGNLTFLQSKLNLMAVFMRNKYENPKMKQFEIANQLHYSSSTLQKYRNDNIMLSPYRIQPNNTNKRTKNASYTNFNNISHHEPDVKRPQMTSNNIKTPQTNTKSNKKNKKKLEAGSVHENIAIKDQ